MENFTFYAGGKEQKLHGVLERPKEKPIGIVQVIHGMCEYIGRYSELFAYLSEKGFVVIGHDHPGHGESVESAQDLGYIGEKPTLAMLAAIHAVRERATKEYPGLPFFMLGHSMGSYLLRCYLAKHGKGVSGAVVMGTGFVPPAKSTGGIAFLRMMAAVHGWRYRSETARNLTYDAYYKQFDVTGNDLDNSWLTRDREEAKAYYADEKCAFLFTLNGYLGLIGATRISCRKKNIERLPKELPLLLISGSSDPVGALGTGVTKVYDMMCASGMQHVSMKLYEGARHELLHETCKEDVLAEIGDYFLELA